jgi:hypothetical protein
MVAIFCTSFYHHLGYIKKLIKKKWQEGEGFFLMMFGIPEMVNFSILYFEE